MQDQRSTSYARLTSNETAPAPLNYAERLMLLRQAMLDARVSRAALKCLAALESHYNHAEGAARPSQATVAREIGSTRQRVNLYIRELTETGYVVAQRGQYGKRYRLLPPVARQHGLMLVPDVTGSQTSPDVTGSQTSELQMSPDPVPQMSPDPRHRTKVKNQESTFSTPDSEWVSDADASAPPPKTAKPAKLKEPAVKPHRLPADWEPSQDLIDWAVTALQIPRPVVDTQTVIFQQYFWDNPKVCRPGWAGSFKTWMHKAKKGGSMDAVTPWERAQRGGHQGNGISTHVMLDGKKKGADFGYPGMG